MKALDLYCGEGVSNVKRPILRYHGGKWKIAPWIIAQMPAHRVYVEPFGGAASVLMRKPRATAEVYNDLDGSIVNVFQVLRDRRRAAELERKLRLTPFSRADFEASYDAPKNGADGAYKTIVRSFMGFSTDATTRQCKTGFRANKVNGKFPAQEWATYPDAISAFVERLRGVVIEQRDAFEVIAAYDSAETLFFVDPPYVMSTRGNGSAKHGYKHEMDDYGHRKLSMILREVKGKVLLCGYWSHLYEELYGDWEREEHSTFANGAHKRIDCVWCNFEYSRGTNGTGVQTAMSTDGMQEADRHQASDAEVLFGRVPAEGRPRDAQGNAEEQATGALRPMPLRT